MNAAFLAFCFVAAALLWAPNLRGWRKRRRVAAVERYLRQNDADPTGTRAQRRRHMRLVTKPYRRNLRPAVGR